MKVILVVGATGLLGGLITQQLLQKGKEVRILVRHGSPAAEFAQQGLGTPAELLVEAGAKPIYGDLKDRVSLDEACAGVETVITTANSILRGGKGTIESVDLKGTQSLIEAARGASVGHFIYTLAAGVDMNHPNLLFQAKATCEARLAASGIDYTILKPGVFMEVWIGAVVGIPLQVGVPVTLVGQGDHRHAFVTVQDVAAYAVTAVDNPLARNKFILIAGPDAYTWTEIVQTVRQVLRQPLSINYVAMGESIPLIPENMSPLLSALETYEDNIEMDETASLYDIQPTSLAAFAKHFFGAARNTPV